MFSPFGKQYLKKLLQFHVVPQQIFHTDYYLNATRGSKSEVASADSEEVNLSYAELLDSEYQPTSLADLPHFQRPPMPKRPDNGRGDHGKCKAKVTRHVLPTLLGSAKNESLAVNVYEYRLGFGKGPLVRRITAGHVGQDEHDYSKVFISDGVAWGGAVHVSLFVSLTPLQEAENFLCQVIGSLIRPSFTEHHDHQHPDARVKGYQSTHSYEMEYYKTLFA